MRYPCTLIPAFCTTLLQTIARGLTLNRANSEEGARVLTFGQFVGFITVN